MSLLPRTVDILIVPSAWAEAVKELTAKISPLLNNTVVSVASLWASKRSAWLNIKVPVLLSTFALAVMYSAQSEGDTKSFPSLSWKSV